MSFKRCKNCGHEVSHYDEFCSSCGAVVKEPIYKKWWFWLIIIIVILLGASSKIAISKNIKFKSINFKDVKLNFDLARTDFDDLEKRLSKLDEARRNRAKETIATETEEATIAETENENLIDGKFELVNGEVTVINDGVFNYITGSLRNTTNTTYSYAQVNFNLYDADGAQVGSTLDNINNWEAGGVWKFKAIIVDDDAVSYDFVDISAF